MNITERVGFIRETLERLYPDPQIPLDHRDAFTLLVAVVLSAQSTDKKVNQITPELFARAATPDELFVLGEERIRQIIRPIGLSPQKARALAHLSKIIVDEYNGVVPESFEALESLPGVGHKTASVVMSQAFGHPAFPVDTHIHRLMWRWKLSNGSSVERTERDAKRLFAQDEWNLLHLRMIFFGREYCPARGHDLKRCPICSVIGRRSMFRAER
jgi:endonuclease III